MDYFARLNEIADLKGGWFDGESEAYTKEEIDYAKDFLADLASAGQVDFYIYPSVHFRGIRLEKYLDIANKKIDVSVDLNTKEHSAYYRYLDLDTNEEKEASVYTAHELASYMNLHTFLAKYSERKLT